PAAPPPPPGAGRPTRTVARAPALRASHALEQRVSRRDTLRDRAAGAPGSRLVRAVVERRGLCGERGGDAPLEDPRSQLPHLPPGGPAREGRPRLDGGLARDAEPDARLGPDRVRRPAARPLQDPWPHDQAHPPRHVPRSLRTRAPDAAEAGVRVAPREVDQR